MATQQRLRLRNAHCVKVISMPKPTVPFVKFNSQHVTDEVRADIAATLRAEARLANSWHDIYPVAVASVEDGRNVGRLASALIKTGWTNRDATELARYVHNRATAIIGRTRALSVGIREAEWLYSGAGCRPYGPLEKEEDVRRDAAHQRANRTRYLVAEGLNIEGVQTWPGMQRHCKCVPKAIVAGLS